MSYADQMPQTTQRPQAAPDGVDVRALSGAWTMTALDGEWHLVDPGGADRSATLWTPSAAQAGRQEHFFNTADAQEYLTILQAGGGSTVAVIPPGGSASVIAKTDGTWALVRRSSGYELLYVSPAASTAITGATETEAMFDTKYAMPANKLQAGSVLRVRGQGIHTATTGAETHSIILKIGALAIETFAAVDPANNDIFYFDVTVIVRTAGAGGTVVACGVGLSSGAEGTGTAKPVFLASSTLDTTAAADVGVSIDRQAAATDGDSARLDVLIVEKLS